MTKIEIVEAIKILQTCLDRDQIGILNTSYNKTIQEKIIELINQL